MRKLHRRFEIWDRWITVKYWVWTVFWLIIGLIIFLLSLPWLAEHGL